VATKTSSAAQAASEEPEAQAESNDAPEPDSEKPGGDLQKHFDELEELIRENPLLATAAAAGVGLVVGLLLSRR
jgi:ElaB/YqjD/DUF883 family membrane-anchored ribosome-binding protein